MIDDARYLLSFLPQNTSSRPPYAAPADLVDREAPELDTLVPDSPNKPYDIKRLIRALSTTATSSSSRPKYATNIVCGFARLGGHSVGIVGNQPSSLAGVLDIDASVKAARFVRTCDAFGIPLQRGRSFNDGDNEQSIKVAIINETMARQYWPGEDPLGKRFTMDDPNDKATWVTIVGVAGDVRQMGVDEPVKAEMYFPYQQGQEPFYTPRDLTIRTSVDPLSLVAAVRNEIHQVDPEQPISNIRTMGEMLGEETASRSLGMTLLTIFAGLALLLATVGIYGVLAYFVVQHTQEIGVRMALGAQRSNILALVLKKGMTLTLLGVALD